MRLGSRGSGVPGFVVNYCPDTISSWRVSGRFNDLKISGERPYKIDDSIAHAAPTLAAIEIVFKHRCRGMQSGWQRIRLYEMARVKYRSAPTIG